MRRRLGLGCNDFDDDNYTYMSGMKTTFLFEDVLIPNAPGDPRDGPAQFAQLGDIPNRIHDSIW